MKKVLGYLFEALAFIGLVGYFSTRPDGEGMFYDWPVLLVWVILGAIGSILVVSSKKAKEGQVLELAEEGGNPPASLPPVPEHVEESQAEENEPMYNPMMLGKIYFTMVASHYDKLEEVASETEVSINGLQSVQLFRNVCFFYYSLWYHLLHSRIQETNRIPQDKAGEFIEAFRNEAMQSITQAESLPENFRNLAIDTGQDEMQVDFSFYMMGKIPAEWEQDYKKILNATQVAQDGSTLELIARLHLRTYQILGLFPKLDPLGIVLWWNRQSLLPLEYIDKIISKVVPIQE